MYTVYKHTSPNKKVYIGITSRNPLIRWNNGNGYKNNDYFYNAIQKYGWDNFKHEILFENLTKEEAEQKEIKLIAEYKSNDFNFGYNRSIGGEHSNFGSKQINKILFNKFKVISYENSFYTLFCLSCNKTFKRNALSKVRVECPYENPINHYITYKNETRTITEWSKILNIPVETLAYREKHKLDLVIGKTNKIKIIVQCSVCGKTFKRKDKQNKYCSRECHYIGLRKK